MSRPSRARSLKKKFAQIPYQTALDHLNRLNLEPWRERHYVDLVLRGETAVVCWCFGCRETYFEPADANGTPLIDIQRARIMRHEVETNPLRVCPACMEPNPAPVAWEDCRLAGTDESVCCWSCHGIHPNRVWCSGIELSLKELYAGASGRELFRVCCGVLNSGALRPGSPGFERFVSAVRARARYTPIGPVLKR